MIYEKHQQHKLLSLIVYILIEYGYKYTNKWGKTINNINWQASTK